MRHVPLRSPVLRQAQDEGSLRRRLPTWVAVGLSAAAAYATICVLLVDTRAYPHDAPAGWSYPTYCCSGIDCREVAASSISERPEGYVIKGTGEIVGYTDARIKPSPDGVYHWCSVAGADDSRTICLFVPPKGF